MLLLSGMIRFKPATPADHLSSLAVLKPIATTLWLCHAEVRSDTATYGYYSVRLYSDSVAKMHIEGKVLLLLSKDLHQSIYIVKSAKSIS